LHDDIRHRAGRAGRLRTQRIGQKQHRGHQREGERQRQTERHRLTGATAETRQRIRKD
jgi:hypothetical protein